LADKPPPSICQLSVWGLRRLSLRLICNEPGHTLAEIANIAATPDTP